MNTPRKAIAKLLRLSLSGSLWLLPFTQSLADETLGRIDRGVDWEYCNPFNAPQTAESPPPPVNTDQPQIEADQMFHEQQTGQSLLLGNVQIWRLGSYAEADRLLYHQADRSADLFGNLFLQQPGLRLSAEQGHVELDANRGWLSDGEFRLTQRNARGSTARAEMLSRDLHRYEQVTYTTCPPGRRDWSLKASTMEIDMAEGWGSAKHARLNIAGIPVFYSPYFTFPVDDRRKTGFLIPSMGSTNRLGSELETPYYFNLAPNFDATLSPRLMSKRGLMLGSEFRYLGERQQMVISGEILPKDRMHSTEHGEERRSFQFWHVSRLAPGLTSRIETSAVSDNDFLDDFGDGQATTSIRKLERVGELAYRVRGLSLIGRLQEFQTIDAGSQPYRRMPQLLTTYHRLLVDTGIYLYLNGEYTDFRHDSLIEGERLTLRPALSLPLRRSWGHLTPRISLNYAGYSLNETQAPGDPRPDYFVPAFSLDSGLVFERDSSWFGSDAYQTLEPRLYYLYAPYDDQSAVPDFDTTDLAISFANLFKETRFSGGDRFGDANQLTFGLTTRWLEAGSGVERLRASIGQIFYRRDREVQLTGAVETNPSSSMVAELSTRFGDHWRGLLTLRRNPHVVDKHIDRGRLSMHYQTPHKQLFNLDYNFSRNTVEDLVLSFNWPFNHKFAVSGKWKYSYLYEQNMNRIIGFEYGGRCCWKLRALYQRYLIDEQVDAEEDRRLMLQLVLTGFGAFGTPVDEMFEEQIYGYRAE